MELKKSQKFQKSQKRNSETVIKENNKKMPKQIPKERYIFSEER